MDVATDRLEWLRFAGRVVAGPGVQDCHLWVGAIGSDGYGRFAIRRDGARRVVRAPRYALAAALGGRALNPGVFALHECDNPSCVRVVCDEDVAAGVERHVVGGSQRHNL